MKLRDLYAMAVQVETTTKLVIFRNCSAFHYRTQIEPDFEYDGWDSVPESFKNDKVILFAIEDNTLIVCVSY